MTVATWALIACSKTKADHPCTAREMYWPSALFRGAWRVAKARGEEPLILSAKHGLLLPEELIVPYDETLSGQPKGIRIDWAERVISAIIDSWSPIQDRFVSYLGQDYAEFLVPELRSLGFEVEEPLKGMCQGKRLAWFKQQAERKAG